MNDRILLIRSGGTIDSEPYADASQPPAMVDTLHGAESLIMQTVNGLPGHALVDHFTWGSRGEDRFVKDSQKFDEEDISLLADIIRNDPRRHFILTHGTDAMAKNARLLQQALAGSGKTVIFTGAMVPLSMSKTDQPSDGVAALAYTLEHIREQPAGVYVAGRDATTRRMSLFDPQRAEKNRDLSLKDLAFTLNTR